MGTDGLRKHSPSAKKTGSKFDNSFGNEIILQVENELARNKLVRTRTMISGDLNSGPWILG